MKIESIPTRQCRVKLSFSIILNACVFSLLSFSNSYLVTVSDLICFAANDGKYFIGQLLTGLLLGDDGLELHKVNARFRFEQSQIHSGGDLYLSLLPLRGPQSGVV